MADGNELQNKIVLESVAEAAAVNAILKYKAHQLDSPEARIPAPLKWAGGVVAALFTAGTATLAGWLVFSVSDMQVTLARMDERQSYASAALDSRFGEYDRRISKLETYHVTGDRR